MTRAMVLAMAAERMAAMAARWTELLQKMRARRARRARIRLRMELPLVQLKLDAAAVIVR
jgi:hypothetical protein